MRKQIGALLALALAAALPCGATAAEMAPVSAAAELVSGDWTALAKRYPMPYFFASDGDVKDAPTPEVLAAWWDVLGDETLSQLIRWALEGNRDLAASRAKFREARAALGISEAAVLPWLDASTSLTNSKTGADASSSGAQVGPRDYYKLGIDASWEIDLFGGKAQKIKASAADLQAQFGALHAGQEAAGYRRRDPAAVQQQMDVGAAAFAQLVALVGQEHLVGLGRAVFGAGPHIGVAPAGLVAQQRIRRGKPRAPRQPQGPYPVFRQRLVRMRRNLGMAVARQQQAHAQRICAFPDRVFQSRDDPVRIEVEAGRACRGPEPGQMPVEAHEAVPRLAAQGFDQPEAGADPVATRAFSRHSAYSSSAVESNTTPPPTL